MAVFLEPEGRILRVETCLFSFQNSFGLNLACFENRVYLIRLLVPDKIILFQAGFLLI
jgi:hypothetical protein